MQIYQAYAGIQTGTAKPLMQDFATQSSIGALIAVSCKKLRLGGPIDGSCFGSYCSILLGEMSFFLFFQD